eukprot:scaffold5520_cov167-Amphora_coffeaeformis.AAC.2
MFRAIVLSSLLFATVQGQDNCPATWVCPFTETPPTLDADFADWADVPGYSTSMLNIDGTEYTAGVAEYKCLHDNTNIYFALSIPGEYTFDPTNDKLCAAIATMFKVGADATYVDMGGCPDAALGCGGIVPDTCSSYLVDIGAHWELSTTQQGVMYGMNATSGTGKDLLAGKDDEFGVHSECRLDDQGANAGIEWSGAWSHSENVTGELGDYHFELSRLLATQSTTTDVQMSPGGTYKMGIAFWDPNQFATGWTDSGHYLTGCGNNWVDLVLGDAEDETEAPAQSSASRVGIWSAIIALSHLFFSW